MRNNIGIYASICLSVRHSPHQCEEVSAISFRKVIYMPATGRRWSKRLKHLHNDAIAKREMTQSEISQAHGRCRTLERGEHVKIDLLIVDDSALVRQVLTRVFAQASDIEVVGTATKPLRGA